MNQLFAAEQDVRCAALARRMEQFYATCSSYDAFREPSDKPQFWKPIKAAIARRLAQNGHCRVLEFGAGCSNFPAYLGPRLRSSIEYDVQDLTPATRQWLDAVADHAFYGDLMQITSTYDVIFSTFVLEHVSCPERLLRHLVSLLRPRGSLFLVSPRYDFPFRISPSARHYSRPRRALLALWLMGQRLRTLATGRPRFLIHLDPAALRRPWFRDSDAIHWVSYYDLARFLGSYGALRCHRLEGARSLKAWLVNNYMVLFVEFERRSEALPPLSAGRPETR